MYRENNDNVAGAVGRRKCHNNVAGDVGRRRCNCECVYFCLLELLADALEENNHCRRRRCDCECVYECLFELLADALEEDGRHHKCPR